MFKLLDTLLEQKERSRRVSVGGFDERVLSKPLLRSPRQGILCDTSYWRRELKPNYIMQLVQLYTKVMQLCTYLYLDLYFHVSFIF
jgi:hypothetical protein